MCVNDAQQDVVAADDESSFTFDVEGLGDEALDAHPQFTLAVCSLHLMLAGIEDVD